MRVNVTIPVYNEEAQLPSTIHTLASFLKARLRFDYEIIIANNASTDKTLEIAQRLARSYAKLSVVHLPQKGRGRAIKKVWSESSAEIMSYMDVDLSTELEAFPKLIEPLAGGQFDLAIGSRLQKESRMKRGWRRDFISKSYNWLVRRMFSTRFSDAQCGFKAISRKAGAELLPRVQDNAWFFDTELLILAEKSGYRIFDLAVTWVDDPDSRVKIIPTALADLKGLLRVRQSLRKEAHGDLRRIRSERG